jgi:bifunctional UDP-N-acetylglucosamine pyrophosphorylase / glucosamine-1-phosphate N-acetyltransferase
MPLLDHVLRAVRPLAPERLIVVLGQAHELVAARLPGEALVALQREQRGTGHAVLSAAELIPEGPLLVVPGDTPLITAEVLRELARAHAASAADATVLTMRLPDPAGYGRIIRGAEGLVERIVEHRDAGRQELAVDEVNAGMYLLPGRRTLELLEQVGSDNAQGEIYLTDVVSRLRLAGGRVAAHLTDDPLVALGVNTRTELAQAQSLMRDGLLHSWMLNGVTIDDPASTAIDVDVQLESDVRLLPFTSLLGRTRIAGGSVIGPGVTLIDTIVGPGCRITHSYAQGAVVEEGATVGPFAHLRRGDRLGRGSSTERSDGCGSPLSAPATIEGQMTDRARPSAEANQHGD